MISNGLKWIKMDSNGFKWIHFNSNGYKWIHLDSHGFEWIHMDPKVSNGFKWIQSYTVDSYGTTSTACLGQWTAPRSSESSAESSAEGCKINIKHNKQFVEGTSNRAEPSSFSPNRGHICQDGGCGGHPLARGTRVTSESEAAIDL